ncbi:MAG: HD domain-containing protein [bacterium]
MKKIQLNDIKQNKEIKEFLAKTDEYLGIIGYTEHGERHANITANFAHDILTNLNFSKRDAELAAIAGYVHDIGNVIGRPYHGQFGTQIISRILREMGMENNEIIPIMAAVGNHEEDYSGNPVNSIAASLIIADKADVHLTRVRTAKMINFDMHDRVNYAVKKAFLKIKKDQKIISLNLTIDTNISQVMEYFEIFLSRMIISRRAANFLKCNYELVINKTKLL